MRKRVNWNIFFTIYKVSKGAWTEYMLGRKWSCDFFSKVKPYVFWYSSELCSFYYCDFFLSYHVIFFYSTLQRTLIWCGFFEAIHHMKLIHKKNQILSNEIEWKKKSQSPFTSIIEYLLYIFFTHRSNITHKWLNERNVIDLSSFHQFCYFYINVIINLGCFCYFIKLIYTTP